MKSDYFAGKDCMVSFNFSSFISISVGPLLLTLVSSDTEGDNKQRIGVRANFLRGLDLNPFGLFPMYP